MKTWPYFFLLSVTFCVCIITIPVVHSKCIPDQQQSLLHFKSSLLFNASVSSKLIYWNSSTDCCSWAGVTCSDDGRVLGIDISSESISGDIDNSISLLQLQHLQSLNMADNKLGNNSSISSAVGKLMRLSGNVPGRDLTTWQAMMTDEDGAPSKLNHLPFQDSRTAGYYQDSITVTIKGREMEIGRSLTIFTSVDLSCNNFTGSIPEEIGDLKSNITRFEE